MAARHDDAAVLTSKAPVTVHKRAHFRAAFIGLTCTDGLNVSFTDEAAATAFLQRVAIGASVPHS